MPDWVTGNQVYISSNQQFRIVAGDLVTRTAMLLTEEATSEPANFMFLPGILRGFNVFVGTNTSSADLDINFGKQVYNGVAGHASETEFTLFTIPAGVTGNFCAPKITTELADRSWARWDLCAIVLRRTGSGGELIRWTAACCLEITEETLLDTQQPPNRPIQG